MRRHWDEETPAADWTLSEEEVGLLGRRVSSNCLGLAVQLKFFQLEGRFPRDLNQIPVAGLDFLAGQLRVSPEVFCDYDLRGRSAERHRERIRDFLGYRSGTKGDANRLQGWLVSTVLPCGQKTHRCPRIAMIRVAKDVNQVPLAHGQL